jgi:histidinol-phosphate aminotransferase
MFNLSSLIRPHIRTLKPYASARDEYQGSEGTFLDANENSFGTAGLPADQAAFHRYPDPYQTQLKQRLAEVKHVSPKNIFLGNGSDEIIDLLIKAFCEPEHDNVVSLPPTFGMYRVAAAVNNVPVHEAALTEAFTIDEAALRKAVDERTKIIFFCSPNNPTGNLLNRAVIEHWLEEFPGLVVVDEAYHDFAQAESFASRLPHYPNLVVLHTLSKAWGMAALRLGMAFASPEITAVLNKIKMPYNVNALTQQRALELLEHDAEMHRSVRELVALRKRLAGDLLKLPVVEHVYPSDANFLLVRVQNAPRVYEQLLAQKIIVRNQSHQPGCAGALRITVGTPDENQALLNALATLAEPMSV